MTTGALTQDDFRNAAERNEQRQSPRYPSNRTIKYLPCRGSEQWGFRPATLLDVSGQGIGMMTHEPLEPEEQFLVKFFAGELVMLVYSVRYCRPMEPSAYRIGAKLIGFIGSHHRENPDWVLQMFLSPQPAGPTAE